MKARSLTLEEMQVVCESLRLSGAYATGLQWRRRPRHHFERRADWENWNKRFARRKAGTKRGNGCGWQVELAGRVYPVWQLMDVLVQSAREKSVLGSRIEKDQAFERSDGHVVRITRRTGKFAPCRGLAWKVEVARRLKCSGTLDPVKDEE